MILLLMITLFSYIEIFFRIRKVTTNLVIIEYFAKKRAMLTYDLPTILYLTFLLILLN